MSHYYVGEWTEQICWNCGHYESDSPAYKQSPDLFVNIVRDDPTHFLKKILLKASDGFLQRKKPDKDFTEPTLLIYKEIGP